MFLRMRSYVSLKLFSACISGPVEHVQLLVPFVVIKNKEVNLTAMVWPSHSRTVTYFWWLGNNTEVSTTPSLTLTFSLNLPGDIVLLFQIWSLNYMLPEDRAKKVTLIRLCHVSSPQYNKNTKSSFNVMNGKCAIGTKALGSLTITLHSNT